MKYVINVTLSIFILFLTSFSTPFNPISDGDDLEISDVEPIQKTLYTWDNLIERIKKREGLMLKPYRCPAGYMTIGYGHLITERDSTLLSGITEAQADSLLRRDLNYSKKWVERNLQLKGTQLMAITNFCFAFGNSKLYRSTLYQKLKEGEPIDEEIMRWININGRPNDYLKKEREFEVWLFNLNKTKSQKQSLN